MKYNIQFLIHLLEIGIHQEFVYNITTFVM